MTTVVCDRFSAFRKKIVYKAFICKLMTMKYSSKEGQIFFIVPYESEHLSR